MPKDSLTRPRPASAGTLGETTGHLRLAHCIFACTREQVRLVMGPTSQNALITKHRTSTEFRTKSSGDARLRVIRRAIRP
jgi:hypothetical protein